MRILGPTVELTIVASRMMMAVARIATAPARGALRLVGIVAEDALDPHLPAAASSPATSGLAPQSEDSSRNGDGNGAGTAAVTAAGGRVSEHLEAPAALVAESADPGAEDGAGASIRVQPPWRGYGRMRAAEVTARLPAEPDVVVSLLLLYERAHRARRTVLTAAERELASRG